MRRSLTIGRTLGLGALALAALGCARHVPIEGASCPCPVGYTCEGGDHCVASAAPPTRVSVGDEVVVGQTGSGRYLFTLGAPTVAAGAPSGQVMVRDLKEGGPPSKSGRTLSSETVWLSRSEDAAVLPGLAWTPTLGFQQTADDPVRLSPDGRFLATAQDGAPAFLSLRSTARAAVADALQSIELHVPLGAALTQFSPDSAFLYVLEPGNNQDVKARLSRVPTDANGVVRKFEDLLIVDAEKSDLGHFAYGPDGTMAFHGPGGIWVWRPKDDDPVLLRADGPGDAQIRGFGGDTLYVELGERDASYQRIDPRIERDSISSGARSPMLATSVEWLTPSPDASVAVVVSIVDSMVQSDLVDLLTHLPVAAVDRCSACTHRFELGFSPDSRWLFGAEPVVVPGPRGELWLGDAVSIDTRTGARRALAPQSVAHNPLFVGADQVVYVKLASEDSFLPRYSFPSMPPVEHGDLVLVSLATGAETLLVRGADEFIALRGRQVAFSRHDQGEADGVYLLDLP